MREPKRVNQGGFLTRLDQRHDAAAKTRTCDARTLRVAAQTGFNQSVHFAGGCFKIPAQRPVAFRHQGTKTVEVARRQRVSSLQDPRVLRDDVAGAGAGVPGQRVNRGERGCAQAGPPRRGRLL